MLAIVILLLQCVTTAPTATTSSCASPIECSCACRVQMLWRCAGDFNISIATRAHATALIPSVNCTTGYLRYDVSILWSANSIPHTRRTWRHTLPVHDARECGFSHTVTTNRWLCFLAMGMYTWKPTRWVPPYVQRSKSHVSNRYLGDRLSSVHAAPSVCIKTMPSVTVAALGVHDVVALMAACGGVLLLVIDVHFALALCAALSLAYWCSSLWIVWASSPIVGGLLLLIGVSKRQSVLLFPGM